MVFARLAGLVELVDCVTRHPSSFFSGPYGFVLRHPRRLPHPISWPGRLGIFEVPAELLAPYPELLEALSGAQRSERTARRK